MSQKLARISYLGLEKPREVFRERELDSVSKVLCSRHSDNLDLGFMLLQAAQICYSDAPPASGSFQLYESRVRHTSFPNITSESPDQ